MIVIEAEDDNTRKVYGAIHESYNFTENISIVVQLNPATANHQDGGAAKQENTTIDC